jgi:cellulose biosynthesis protein BcsQ
MKTIAFYNLKSGVGKTASAVTIAHLAAKSRLRTLLWDLDPQGAASWYLAPDDVHTFKSRKLLKRKVSPADLAVETRYDRLSLIPADFSYREFDLALERIGNNRGALDNIIEPFSETHSLAILDCPPSLSRLAEQVFAVADAIFVPLVPTHLSLRAFEQVHHYMKEKKLGHKHLYPFFTMVDLHRNLHRQLVEQPPEQLRRLMLSYIPYSSMIEKMGEFRAPVTAFAASHPAGRAYTQLWQDIFSLLL